MLHSLGHRSLWWREICRWCQRELLACHLCMVEVMCIHGESGVVKRRMKREMDGRTKRGMERGKERGKEGGKKGGKMRKEIGKEKGKEGKRKGGRIYRGHNLQNGQDY